MKLSLGAIALLKHVVSYTGQTEVNAEGKEIQSLRRLNGEESAQRRHYFKIAEEVGAPVQTELSKLIEDHNAMVSKKQKEHIKAEGETEAQIDDCTFSLKCGMIALWSFDKP
jgi:hypothetical protein